MIPIKDDQQRYSAPVINYLLIGTNIFVFLLEQTFTKRQLDQLALIPAHLWAPHTSALEVITPFFTHMFLHAGWAHVLGNMLFLYIFGDNVEDYLGHFKYLLFYLLSGLFAAAAQVAVSAHSRVPMVGASGAIAGVLGAYFMLYPRARVLTWLPPIFFFHLPAWIVLGYWFVLQFLMGASTLSMTRTRDMGGVAVWAHVGGFVSGLVMIKIFPERARRYPYAYR